MPMKEFSNKTVYYKDDAMKIIHRDEDEGPAILFKKEDACIYYMNNQVHRESGPARVYKDIGYYYYYDKCIASTQDMSDKEWSDFVRSEKLKVFQ